MSPDILELLERFRSRRAKLGVVGLGYVGIPLALTAVESGFKVLGFDIDEPRVAQINRGESFIKHIPSGRLRRHVVSGELEATHDFDRLAEVDAILIAVPTPLSRQREPDLTFVSGTTEVIARHLRPGQLVVLESTTYPGTTRDVMKPILERAGLKSGVDFFLAYSPEREDPGNERHSTKTIPKIVGGDGEHALALAGALYGALVDRIVPVSSLETAEAVKLTENVFRAVNIALVNELKVVYDAMGIDVWEVIDAAATKPFGFMPFYPGPGLGGHCVPIDPFYLSWKAREFDTYTRFIELAGQINTLMPAYVVQRTGEALDARRARGLSGARVLILGVAYKKDVNDLRESPSLKLIELFEGRGARVDYHDTFIPVITPSREHARLAGRCSIELTCEALSNMDVVVIATDHSDVDYGLVVKCAPLVIDTRNICAKRGLAGSHIVKA
jgi:UDP-N-acetyl-D-glucosamine dehydrogenase